MYCCACWMTRSEAGESWGCWATPLTCGRVAIARSAAAVARGHARAARRQQGRGRRAGLGCEGEQQVGGLDGGVVLARRGGRGLGEGLLRLGGQL